MCMITDAGRQDLRSISIVYETEVVESKEGVIKTEVDEGKVMQTYSEDRKNIGLKAWRGCIILASSPETFALL